MPENAIIPEGAAPSSEAVPETAKEKFERERLSRRQALKRFGMTSAMTAFVLFSVDDLARMVGKAMQQRAGDNKIAAQLAQEFQNAGVAFADGTSGMSPSGVTVSDPVSGGVILMVGSWDNAVQAYASLDEQTAYDSSVTEAHALLAASDALYYRTSQSAEYYPDVATVWQSSQQIKMQLHGDLLLSSVNPAGVLVPVSGGQYNLGINPSTGSFILHDGATNQPLQTTSYLGDLSPYITANDVATLPLTSGAVDQNGNIPNYSSTTLAAVVQSGSNAKASLLEAQGLRGNPPHRPNPPIPPPSVAYYIHEKTTITLTYTVFGKTTVTTKPNDHWSPPPGPQPAGAVLIGPGIKVDYSFSQTIPTPVGNIPARVHVVGTEDIWKK